MVGTYLDINFSSLEFGSKISKNIIFIKDMYMCISTCSINSRHTSTFSCKKYL